MLDSRFYVRMGGVVLRTSEAVVLALPHTGYMTDCTHKWYIQYS